MPDATPEQITNYLTKNKWAWQDLERRGIKQADPYVMKHRFLSPSRGLGEDEVYVFKADGRVENTTIFTYTKGQEQRPNRTRNGRWRLPDYGMLELEFEGKIEVFEIKYLSEAELRLKVK